MITKRMLQNILNYDPHSGEFTRTVSGGLVGSIVEVRPGARYVKISILGKEYYAHRLALIYMKGGLAEQEVDEGIGKINHLFHKF